MVVISSCCALWSCHHQAPLRPITTNSTSAITEAQRARLLKRLAGRLAGTVLTIDASEHRSQHLNRTAARGRMAMMLRAALAPPPPARKATRPSRGAVERRLAAKRRRSEVKARRGRPDAD